MYCSKITETRFYNRYGNKKVALLEKGQKLRVDSVYGFDEYHFENIYLCRVVNPSETSKNYGVREGMLVKVYEENLEKNDEVGRVKMKDEVKILHIK